MAHDSRAVANFILDYAETQGRRLTLMALLKVLYFAHGWHLAQFGTPLIRNAFEAWQYGPVVRIVYDCFRTHGRKLIDGRATRFDPITGKREVVSYALTDADATLLRNSFSLYGGLDAFTLSNLTHEPGSPWDRVWNATGGRVTLGMRIPDEFIREHFLSSRPPGPAH